MTIEKAVPYPRLPCGLVTTLLPKTERALSGVINFLLLCSIIVLMQLIKPGGRGLLIVALELFKAIEYARLRGPT